MKLTGSYLGANLILYCLAGFYFGLYFLFSGNNPLVEIKNIFTSFYNKKLRKRKV